FRIEDGLEREEDVGGGERLAVRPRDARAQVHGVGATVRRRLPLLREPRLELEGGAIDSNEPPLREEAEQLHGLLARDEAVERARDGANGGNQLATTRGLRGGGVSGLGTCGRTPEDEPAREDSRRDDDAEETCL